MSIESLISQYREPLENSPLDLAAESKKNHPDKKLIGCYPVYTPVELIHAAGMLPVGVIGAGNRLEIAHADSRFQSFVCSIVKSTLELGLTNRLDNLDAMLFHSICDPARNLASVVKRNLPALRVEYLHLPQNMASPRAEDYLVAEYERLLDVLAELTGHRASPAELEESIALYNRARALVRGLYRLRQDEPERLSAAECYVLCRAGTLLPVEEHLELLEAAREA